jgi:SAM-dependent methyltransferase
LARPIERESITFVSTTFAPVSAIAYERSMGRWSRLLATPFIDFVGCVHGSARVLDVGCGTGSLTFTIADRSFGTTVIGIDALPTCINFAREKNHHPGRVSFEVGDACGLPFDDGSFDLTLSALAMNFMPNAAIALGEMVRVTRPGGIVAATLWDIRGGLTYYRMMLDTAAAIEPEAAEWRNSFFSTPGTRPGALAALWREAGLQNVEHDALTIRLEFQSFTDMWEPVAEASVFGAYLRALSENVRRSIRQKVEAAYLCGDQDGPRSFAATAWAVKGIAKPARVDA